MLETMTKMYGMIKATMIKEYGEQFTGMSEEAQAATVAKVFGDLVRNDPKISGILAGKYIAEIA